MNKKTTAIIIAIIIVIGGGILFFLQMKKISSSKTSPAASAPAGKSQQVMPNNAAGNQQPSTQNANSKSEADGEIMNIGEKTIIIETSGGTKNFNITTLTPVVKITDGKSSPSGLYDLKVSQIVKVDYDGTTNNASLITIEK